MIKISLSKKIKIAVIGDIHEHEEQFDEIVEKIKPASNMILVSVGDVYDRGTGIKTAESILNKIKTLNESGCAFIVKGNHELKHLKRAKRDNNFSDELKWMNKQPLYISFDFENNYNVTVMHAGVTPRHTVEKLDSVDICYTRSVNENGKAISLRVKKDQNGKVIYEQDEEGVNWHELYDGRFGYIASGHQAQEDGVAKFYKHSCNLDSACYSTGVLSCQIFSADGLEELITVSGKSYYNDEQNL